MRMILFKEFLSFLEVSIQPNWEKDPLSRTMNTSDLEMGC